MMKSLRNTLLILFLFCFYLLQGQELPPLQNFIPEFYGGENQNWKITQAENKNLYFANNGGLLEFNGATWRLYPSPNASVLRSVNTHGDRIYTGCYREFGYWEKDDFNELKYHSLSKQIADKLLDDEEIWKIIFYNRRVLFQSLHRIYVYDEQEKTFSIINSKYHLPKIFKVGEQIYFQKMEEGLFRLVNGKAVLVSNSAIFRNAIIINIFQKNKGILVQTQEKGFFILDKGKLSKWQTKSTQVIDELSVYSSLQLRDGGFILGTITEGIYHLSAEGEILEHINQKKGLQNNTVLSVFEDAEHNVWLGLDNGISILNFNSPFTVYNDTNGVLGAVYAAALYNGKLYLGTNQGLFYRPNKSEGFKLMKGTKGQVWVLKVIDGQLFCGHNSGTFIVKGNVATKICDLLGTWNIQPVKGKENLLIQGNYEGLHILEKQNGRWTYRNKIEGFNISSRFFEILEDRQILVSHEYKGVFRLLVSKDFQKVLEVVADESVPSGAKSGLITYNKDILYFMKNGIYKFDKVKKHFSLDTILTSSLLNEDNYVSGKLLSGEDNTLWAFTKENIVRLFQGSLDNHPQSYKIPLSSALRQDIAGFENLLHLGGSDYLLVTSKGYIRFDLDKIKDADYIVRIDKIASSKVGYAKENIALNSTDFELCFKENNLHFSYTVATYNGLFHTLYQYRLKGLYEKWSNWSTDSNVSFDNLPAGDYLFEVRARVGNVLTKNTATFRFSILTPWYRSKLMIAAYLLSLFLLLFALNRRYRVRYKKQKQKLEEEKETALTLMQLENEKTVIKLRNEKLRGEVESKNRELAASTMSIVKKNELLNRIKDELKQEKNNPYVKSVLAVIDKNLVDNNDWEFFQEAFNNTDRDFLKKLKEKHAELTPNDLKLCVYLRLNLSSKEIAPMLNISPRSVEIKRYRLRKKMNLEHNQNLTDYILNI